MPRAPDLARVGGKKFVGGKKMSPVSLTWLELVSFVPGAPDLARVCELCARGSVID